MVFEVSQAKKEVLRKLTEGAWTPTDLAEELGKSRNTVYNHLEELHGRGVLTKRRVAAKTRPKTEYSIGRGFLQYIAVLPGQYTEKSLSLTPERQAVLRIWAIPQEAFQPFVENYWRQLKGALDYESDITAVAVYGSVARGEADEDSDVDFLVVTDDEEAEKFVSRRFGSLRIEANGKSKIGMTEAYSLEEYRTSLARGSEFLKNVGDELHVVYDPDGVLRNAAEVVESEQ